MARHKGLMGLIGLIAGLIVATAVAADLYIKGPYTLDKPVAVTSRVGVAGNTAVWIEAPADSSPLLAVRELDGATTAREPIPSASFDVDEPLGWLLDGPEVAVGCSGTCVRVAFLAKSAADAYFVFVWDTATGQWTVTSGETPLFGLALHDDELYFSVAAAGGPDIALLDLTSGAPSTPYVSGPGSAFMPAASERWVAWLHQSVANPQPGVAALMVQPRSGGVAVEVAAESWLVDPAIEGDRVMWVGPYLQGAALHVTDLITGDDGVLASDPRPCRGCQPAEVVRGDLSLELFAYAGLDRMLHVYDARAVTSVSNLATYLRPFTSVQAATGSVAPAIDKLSVVWSEPVMADPSAGSRVQVLQVMRGLIYLPTASTR